MDLVSNIYMTLRQPAALI